MLIFHIAEKSRWDAAKLAGSYAHSTYGRTLEDEGFIHAAREDQWESVRERYYADVLDPLVLLRIDSDKLTSPWREDEVDGASYPHIYGPLNPSAVVGESLLSRAPALGESRDSFARVFLTEILVRMLSAVLVMALAMAGFYAAEFFFDGRHGLIGLGLGILLAAALLVPMLRRRSARLSPARP